MEQAIFRPTAAGWIAYGDGWAVQGSTREEADRLFKEAVERHEEILARPDTAT
jgi:hypothetical protein